MTNPYAVHLAQREAIEVLKESPQRLRQAIARKAKTEVEQPIAPGKWSPKEILCHLADYEIAFGFRLRQALGADKHIIQPFDQDLWAKSYRGLDAQEALEAFCAIRAWNLALVRTIPEQGMRKRIVHPERGEMDIRGLIETFAGHDVNHLRQLER